MDSTADGLHLLSAQPHASTDHARPCFTRDSGCRSLQVPESMPPEWGFLSGGSLSMAQPAGGNGSFLDASRSLARVAHRDSQWPGLLRWLQQLPAVPPGGWIFLHLLTATAGADLLLLLYGRCRGADADDMAQGRLDQQRLIPCLCGMCAAACCPAHRRRQRRLDRDTCMICGRLFCCMGAACPECTKTLHSCIAVAYPCSPH